MAVEEYQTVRYRCTFCRKSWASKYSARKHQCPKDPQLRACGSCRHDLFADRDEYGQSCAMGMLRVEDGRFRQQCPTWTPKPEHVTHIVDLVVVGG